MHRSRVILRSLHAHEIMMGMLTETGRNRMTGASVALRVLVGGAAGRFERRPRSSPAARSCSRSRRRVSHRRPCFPEACSALPLGGDEDNANDNGILREALRLRVRWVQELSGRAAWELGVRLTALRPAHRAGADPSHDHRTRRSRRDEASRRHPRAHHHAPSRVRRAAPVVVPALRHRQDRPRANVGRSRRRYRRGRWRREWAGHLRHREPAGRVGARHHDPAARARTAAPPAQGRGRGNRLGAVAPRHPRPRSPRRDRRRLRGRKDDLPRGSGRARRRRDRPGRRRRRRKPDEDHRLGRGPRDARVGRGAT